MAETYGGNDNSLKILKRFFSGLGLEFMRFPYYLSRMYLYTTYRNINDFFYDLIEKR